MEKMVDSVFDFYAGKRVFVTGHTGFKGSWICKILINLGAIVTGYSLEPDSEENLFTLCGIQNKMHSIIGDVRDYESLKRAFDDAKPEIAIHLAAQPLVRESYINPKVTYETNVIGTVNFLECVRLSCSVKSVLNVTTDKVYENNEWEWGYREIDKLNGRDPYSNSKSCSDLITQCYSDSFLKTKSIAISTARAGNVIGGGDFSKDRIIPDCFRAAREGNLIHIRNPLSTRPYQHVLEPLFFYLFLLREQYYDVRLAGWYNVGPKEHESITNGELVEHFCKAWGSNLSWISVSQDGPRESTYLKLDCSLISSKFNWKPIWDIHRSIEMTVSWLKDYIQSRDISETMQNQILQYKDEFDTLHHSITK